MPSFRRWFHVCLSVFFFAFFCTSASVRAEGAALSDGILLVSAEVGTPPEEMRVRILNKAGSASSSLLSLRATVNQEQASRLSVRAFDESGVVFIHLNDVLRVFDFPISLDREQNVASGFFVTPDKSFKLDVDKHEVQVGSAHYAVTRQNIRRRDGQLFVSQDVLRLWMGINSEIDDKQIRIHFVTRYQLPWEAREIRRQKRLEILGSFSDAVRLQKNSTDEAEVSGDRFALGAMPRKDVNPFATETHDFSGVTLPHNEVELYLNDRLIAYQAADDKGRYGFAKIPLSIGDNDFRLVIYGPQGQQEEKRETVVAQPNLVRDLKPSAPEPMHVENENRRIEKPHAEAPRGDVKTEVVTKVVAKENVGGGMPTVTRSGVTSVVKDWVQLAVVQSDANVGVIEAYTSIRGTYLRLDSFLRFMDIPYTRQKSADAITILMPDKHSVALDLLQKTYTDQEISKKLLDTDAFENDETIYASTDFLYRLFPSSAFIVDLAARKLNVPAPVKNDKADHAATDATAHADVAPTPNAAPVVPVIIDDVVSGKQKVSGSELAEKEGPEALDVLHVEQDGEAAKKGAAQGDVNKSGESLILQPRIKNLPLSNLFIEALEFPGGQIFMPMNDLFQILEFPIKFDKAKNEARGYFFDSNNDFEMNIDKKEVRVGAKKMTLSRRDIRRHDGDIYISTDSFQEWFGIASEIDRPKATIHFVTDKLFPEEEKQARQKKWNKILSMAEVPQKDVLVLQNDYQAISYPAVDVSLGSSFSHTSEAATKKNSFVNTYNVQGAMELGYLTSQFYVQGASDIRLFNVARFQAGRKDPAAILLGGLKATEFAIGDVSSPSVSLLTANSLGRGVSMTNKSVTAAENFDVRNFSGDSVPGYEVELYRNDVLVSFQTVDANGRYNFSSIPVLYGENTFRLVFYGAQGQREERVETISALSALLKQNQFEYTFGAEQRGKSFLPVAQTTTNSLTPAGTQLVSSFRYGVTQNYTLGAAAAETKLSDGAHRYASTTSGLNIAGVLSETTFAKDVTNGGWAGGVSVLGGIDDISLRARYRRYHNFVSEAVNNLTTPLRSEALLEANTQVFLPLVQGFSLGLSGLKEEFVSKDLTERDTYGLRFSKSVWGLGFTNTINFITDDSRRFQDTFGFQTRLWDVNFRASGIYDMEPVSQFRSASFAADYRLLEKMTAQTQVDKDMITGKTTFEHTTNWDFNSFRLSFNNLVTNKGDYTLGLNVLFSLNHNKSSNQWVMQPQQTSSGGAISGRVFVDENNSGVYEDGEKIVTDAGVRVNRAVIKLDENGFFVAPVDPYDPVKVELNAVEMADPLLVPKSKSYLVQTRPGDAVVADFPLAHTTIIDGTTYIMQQDGTRHDIGNIVLELQDKDQKPLRRVLSEVDGYYSFDKVQAGEYWISVPSEVLVALNASIKEKIHIIIDEIKEFITGKDITLIQKVDLSVPPLSDERPRLPEDKTPAPAPTPAALMPVEKQKIERIIDAKP